MNKLTRQQVKYKSLQQDLLKHKLAAVSYREHLSKLQSENLKLKEQLSKFRQMNFWKRLVYLFKGCEK